MTKDQFVSGVAVLALIVAGVAAFVAFSAAGTFGGNTSFQKQSFFQGLFAGNSRQLEITNAGVLSSEANATFADLTLSGGNLTVTQANTATSTVQAGCWQGVATSTATPIAFTLSTIATTTTMANGQTNNGFVLWKYGSCPF